MSGFAPIVNVAIVLSAALVGGMIAHRLRQPVILGFLVVGVAVGPHGLGVVGDLELIETLATVGVALLMFTVGLEISYSQLWQVGKVGIWGGIIQILVTFVLGAIAGKIVFHWSLIDAAFFGLIISLSSTMIGLKLLMERGELDSVHGRIMIAILIVQDLSVVLMMVGVPIFGAPVDGLVPAFAIAVGKAVLFIGVAVVLGIWVLPWLLGTVAGVRSRELFLLTVLILCFGAAFSTYVFGLSMAFGAFIVGLMVRESRFAHQALAEVTPLRDVFATLFFVSLGMLLDPRFVMQNWPEVILAVVVIVVIKFVVCFSIPSLFGYSGRTALFVGVGLVQVGEFSFVLAQAGINSGIISSSFYSLIIASIVVSMLLTPVLLSLTSVLYPRLAKLPVRGRFMAKSPSFGKEEELREPSADVIIGGCGRVGRNVAQSLRELRIPYLVIEMDPEVVAELHRKGEPCIYGDASNIHVLSMAGLGKAKVLVVTYPDPLAVVATVKNALRVNPKLEVVARVHRKREAEQLESLGVKDVISPEYEASFEFLRRTLSHMGWSKAKTEQTICNLKYNEGTISPGDKVEDEE